MKKIYNILLVIMLAFTFGIINVKALNADEVTCSYISEDSKVSFDVNVLNSGVVDSSFQPVVTNLKVSGCNLDLSNLSNYKSIEIDISKSGCSQSLYFSYNCVAGVIAKPEEVGISYKLSDKSNTSYKKKYQVTLVNREVERNVISTDVPVKPKTDITSVCKSIPKRITKIVSALITVLEVAIPLVIIIFGMIDMFKSVTASKEDEIAKYRKIFLKRLITGLLAFFIIFFVRTLIRFVDQPESSGIIDCVNCIINNNCE